MHREITEEHARCILQILKDECGYCADPYDGHGFVAAITTVENDHACSEYRFIGALGFGGKFRNNGNCENTPHVDCYPEHVTPARRLMINNANVRIAQMFKNGQALK